MEFSLFNFNTGDRSIRSSGSIFLLVWLSLALLSCQNSAATPTPSATSATSEPQVVNTSTISATATLSTTVVTSCTPPIGWVSYMVQQGDTLSFLALTVNSTVEHLQRANCLPGDLIVTGQELLLPSLPPPTPTLAPTPTPCGPPGDWVEYSVRPGDTLSTLALVTGVSVEQLMLANCLPGDLIVVGQRFNLPIQPFKVALVPSTGNDAGAATSPSSPSPPCLGSDFTCPAVTSDLSPLVIDAGRPNNPGFEPCSDSPDPHSSEPFVSMGNLDVATTTAQQGERFYFLGCNFPSSTISAIQIEGPQEAPDLIIRSYNFESTSYSMIEWPITCDTKVGNYTVTLTNEQNISASRSFNIDTPFIQRILAIPDEIVAGNDVQVYLCNYKNEETVLVDLFRLTPGDNTEEELIAEINVAIEEGQGTITLRSSPNDPEASYYLRDRLDALKGFTYLRIAR